MVLVRRRTSFDHGVNFPLAQRSHLAHPFLMASTTAQRFLSSFQWMTAAPLLNFDLTLYIARLVTSDLSMRSSTICYIFSTFRRLPSYVSYGWVDRRTYLIALSHWALAQLYRPMRINVKVKDGKYIPASRHATEDEARRSVIIA